MLVHAGLAKHYEISFETCGLSPTWTLYKKRLGDDTARDRQRIVRSESCWRNEADTSFLTLADYPYPHTHNKLVKF